MTENTAYTENTVDETPQVQFVKEVPPAVRAGAGRSELYRRRIATVEELSKNPGVWALVEEDSWAHRIKGWKDLGCEVKTRASGEEDEKGRPLINLYARIPAEEEQAGEVEGQASVEDYLAA